MRKWIVAAAVLAASAVPASAWAATVVDTGQGDSTSGIIVGKFQSVAARFALGGASTITAIRAGFLPPAAPITVSLYSDASSSVGSLLFSASFATGSAFGWYGADSLSWSVGAGAYWAVFQSEATTFQSIALDPLNPLALYATRLEPGGSWSNTTHSAFAVQVDADAAAAVPEPASWAMMIGGFALAGAALRRRATRVRYA